MTEHLPQSGEVLTEAVEDVIRWTVRTAKHAPKPCGGIAAVIPLVEPTELEKEKPEAWSYIRIHATPSGKLVFESPWIVAELDSELFGKKEEWWKELGL